MKKDLLERLKHRIDIYFKTQAKTEFGEITYTFIKTQTVWAEVLPISGKVENIDGGSVRANVTHKITVRNGAIKEPRNDMYFEFKGQKYEVLYFMPHYRRNDLIEFYTKLIIETEEDY